MIDINILYFYHNKTNEVVSSEIEEKDFFRQINGTLIPGVGLDQ